MQRENSPARPDWPTKVESVGLTFHSPEGRPYWDESVCYRFTAAEIDVLEAAGNELHRLCLEAVEHVVSHRRYSDFNLPLAAIDSIRASWEREDFSLYGRFDLAYDGRRPPKLLEYNADTPTSLVEAAVAQWYWLQDVRPGQDQFNSLHERLMAAWRRFGERHPGPVWFGSLKDNLEDAQTVLYLRDTCHQAGLETVSLDVEEIGFHPTRGFVDLEDRPVGTWFKLYPWECLWADEFAEHLGTASTRFLEPVWKMLLSNKAILPLLWELFPDHPNLLPAYEDRPENRRKLPVDVVRKPKLSREGANVTWLRGDQVLEQTGGPYGDSGYILQAAADLPVFSGHHPICGVWIIDHEAGGLGLREDRSRITGNASRFVPHYF